MTNSIKTTVIFIQPFELKGFNEILLAGEYEIETQILGPVDWIEPGTWTSSILVHLHPRASHRGTTRSLTVRLVDLENAIAKEKLTGRGLTDHFLDELLADPMIRLVMQADGVSEVDVRELHSKRLRNEVPKPDVSTVSSNAMEAAEQAKKSPQVGPIRPGIGE